MAAIPRRLQEAYEAIGAPILILLACLIPVSDAVASTGGAQVIAGCLALVIVVAVALTPYLNNAATALIMAPIAADLAYGSGLSPIPS
ncbi:SLC13 family permease [Plastoroseomonas hellenica]|uniref:SLC13 family permease n=1 Tax=Plastoroseomonas hellenica TaxID=2687306 RepID=UPI0034637A8D